MFDPPGSGDETKDDTSQASPLHEIPDFARERLEKMNESNETQVRGAVTDIRDSIRQNVSAASSNLASTGNISNLVHAVYQQAYPGDDKFSSQRTNLSDAEGASGLVNATIGLHRMIGDGLNSSEEEDIREQAEDIPDEIATAGAILTYATIDAFGYLEQAFIDMNHTAWEIVEENTTNLEHLNRRNSSNEGTSLEDGTLNLLEIADRLYESVLTTPIYQSADVIAKALDEVQELDLGTQAVRGIQQKSQCAGDDWLIYATEDCRVIIGGVQNTTYRKMVTAGNNRYDKNVVLLDIGGNETYIHRAGGGRGGPIPAPPFECLACILGVQVNVDIGDGEDEYDKFTSSNDARGGPAHGAGDMGVGVLFDEAGNDVYKATHHGGPDTGDDGVIAQGAARMGAGVLIDKAGDDHYLTLQKSNITAEDDAIEASHGQGVSIRDGFGLLQDQGGDDRYDFNLSAEAANGGGAQGFGSQGGAGFLIDVNGSDTYQAGQDRVQGAAGAEGIGLLLDPDGKDTLEVTSYPGCPVLNLSRCETTEIPAFTPLSGWSQGVGFEGGYGILLVGEGETTIGFNPENPDSPGEYEGTLMGGVGSDNGTGLFNDQSGNDSRDARNASFGFARRSGLGLYSDEGGFDDYECSAFRCHGYADSAKAVHYDGISSEQYPSGEDGPVWTKGDIGAGVHLTGDGS